MSAPSRTNSNSPRSVIANAAPPVRTVWREFVGSVTNTTVASSSNAAFLFAVKISVRPSAVRIGHSCDRSPRVSSTRHSPRKDVS